MKKTILNVLLASFITTNLITTITSATVLDENIEYDFNTSINSTIDELDYSSMISSAQLPTLVKELRLYIESNPNLGEEEINNYFKNLIIENYDENLMILEKNQNNLRYDYANSLPIVSSKLGPTEKQVFNSSPAKGALVLSNAQAAIDMTSQHWIFNDYEYHNDNADAFRHTLWNAYNAHDCGTTYAKKFADAHKKDFPNVALETEMDLFNNSLGRTIGSKSYPGNASQASYAIRQAVLTAVKNGEARRFQGMDIGTKTTLQKTNSNSIK